MTELDNLRSFPSARGMQAASVALGQGVIVSLALSASFALFASPAFAHFVLQAPASFMSEDASGNPQKLGPCGDEGGGTTTGTVTAYQPGQTLTVTINEVVFHPGHYRVALSTTSRSELPAEPAVTAASTPCGSVPIQSPAVFPVLADGVLQHSAAFAGPQSFQVTLPTDVTCSKCTLQVIEFMSNHPLNNPGGCFYHHCADISIQPTTAGSGGTSATGGATAAGGTSGSGGAHPTGRAGSGGASTTGGAVAAGGTHTTGGVGTGGASTTGGAVVAGGAYTTGGAATGGASTTGGNTPLGGAQPTGEATGSSLSTSAGVQGVADSSPNGGCSCSIPGARRGGTKTTLGLLLCLLGLRKRRRAMR
jgi:hypothetical protein